MSKPAITFVGPNDPITWARTFMNAVINSKPLDEIRDSARDFVEKIDKYYEEVTDSGEKVTSLYSHKVLFEQYPCEVNEEFEKALTERFGFQFENIYSAAEFVMDVASDDEEGD